MQIPSVSSPALLYEFSAGLKFVLTLSTTEGNTIGLHAGFAAWLGSTFRFDFAHDHPWGVGVNLVPLVLLVALLKSGKVAESGIARLGPTTRESTAVPLT